MPVFSQTNVEPENQADRYRETVLQAPSREASAYYTEHPEALLRSLIRFKTTTPASKSDPALKENMRCVRFLKNLLAGAGIESEILEKEPGYPNLIARIPGTDPNLEPLVIQAHFDVVPVVQNEKSAKWEYEPFSGAITNGFVWGRGALDMKGAFVPALAALMEKRLSNAAFPRTVLLALMCDEENGGVLGAGFLTREHRAFFADAKYCIGEFGGFSLELKGHRFYPIQVSEKRKYIVQATVRGETGHGSVPQKDKAMARLGQLLVKLNGLRLPIRITEVPPLTFDGMASKIGGPTGFIFRCVKYPWLTNWVPKIKTAMGGYFDAMLRDTVSPTMVQGGIKDNVHPESIELILDARVVPGVTPAELKKELEALGVPDITFNVIDSEKGNEEETKKAGKRDLWVDPDMGLYPLLADILKKADKEGTPVPYLLPASTDGQYFAKIGIQPYGYLPLQLSAEMNFFNLIHGKNERIPVEALNFGKAAIGKLLSEYGKN